MKSSILSIVLSLFILPQLYSQTVSCTSNGNPDLTYFDLTTQGTHPTFTVKVYFTIIRDGSGNNGYDATRISNITDQLDGAFNQHNIFFEYSCESDKLYLDNNERYQFGATNGEWCNWYDPAILRDNDGIHIYIYSHPSATQSFAGRASNIPGNFMVIAGGSFPSENVRNAQIEGTTVVHEMGHLLGLLHMWHGSNQNLLIWDETPSACNTNLAQTEGHCDRDFRCGYTSSSYNCITQSLEFDEDECAEGTSNGDVAGDYIPDTPPSHRYAEFYSFPNCVYDASIQVYNDASQNPSSEELVTPDGLLYAPDNTNFMFTGCKDFRSNFSPNQVTVMKNHLQSHPVLTPTISTDGSLSCECEFGRSIYLRSNRNWSDVVADHGLPGSTLEDLFIISEGDLTLDINYTFNNVNFTFVDDKRLIVDDNTSITIQTTVGGTSSLSTCQNRWKGVLVRNGASLQIFDAEIKKAVTGIRAVDGSSLNMERCILTDHTNAGLYMVGNVSLDFDENIFDNTGQFGIYGRDNDNYLDIEAVTINQATIGIWFNDVSAAIHNGTLSKVPFGILLNRSDASMVNFMTMSYEQMGILAYNSMAIDVSVNTIGVGTDYGTHGIQMRNISNSRLYNNIIKADRYGIEADHISALIDFHDIDVIGTGSSESGCIKITDGNEMQILNNYLDGQDVTFGIESIHGTSGRISNNDVDISSFVSATRAAAIRSMGSMSYEIYDNITNSSNNADGILAQNAPMNDYRCNDISDADDNHGILFNSTFQNIQGNAYYGSDQLDFYTRSELGEQRHHGNEFHGGSVRALGLDVDKLNNSVFYVDGNLPTHLPTDVDPVDFFVDEDNLNPYTCSGQPGPIWTPLNNSISDLCAYWTRIKSDRNLNPNKFFLDVLHLLKYEAIRPSYSLPDCIKLDPILQQECGLLSLADATVSLMDHIKVDDSRTTLTSHLVDIADKQVRYTDTPNAQLIQDIGVIKGLANNDLDSERLADSLYLDQIIGQLDSINCNDTLIDDYVATLSEYISYLQSGSISGNTRSTIGTIAQKCSDTQGDAIHLARSMMNKDDVVYYDAYDGCGETNSFPRASKSSGDILLSAYPNPAHGYINLQFSEAVSGSIKIFNLNGESVYNGNFEGINFTRLDTNFPSGLYIVSAVLSEGTQLTKRILVIQ